MSATSPFYRKGLQWLIALCLFLPYSSPLRAQSLEVKAVLADQIVHTADPIDNTNAAPQEADYRVQLQTRTFTPHPGFSEDAITAVDAAAQRDADAAVHFLLQLYETPSEEQSNALAQAGIRLLLYIPEQTWVATASVATLSRMAVAHEQSLVRWVGALRPEDKVSPALQAGEFGAWYYNAATNRVIVHIQFHTDVDLDVAEALVTRRGGSVIEKLAELQVLLVEAPVDQLPFFAQEEAVLWIEPPLPGLSAENNDMRRLLQVNILEPSPYQPIPQYGLDGNEVDVLVYDVGQAWHSDYRGRVVRGDSTPIHGHAIHVAGTVAGDGQKSAGVNRGMAPKARIISYGYQQGISGIPLYDNPGDLVMDWQAAKNIHGAEIGTASLASNLARNGHPCALEGAYGVTSQQLDQIVQQQPLITTWAAGNERGAVRCGTTYRTIPPPSCAKNPIQVGATDKKNAMSSFSSWGPCQDGRIKPIVVAPGVSILSTYENDGYASSNGTSMSTPGVAGVIALMVQQYRKTYTTNGAFLPSTAKAILMNSSTDLGARGPDYQFGFGLVNAKAAVDTIIAQRFYEAALTQNGQVDEYTIQVAPNQPVLQVSLAWDDPAAAPMAAKTLVNNLTLEVVNAAGHVFHPWLLNPQNPSAAATTGPDTLNNQEQVTIYNPPPGNWRIRVHGQLNSRDAQKYSLAANPTFLPVGTPTLVSVAPDSGKQGETLDVMIVGRNTNFIAGNSSVTMGAGITVNRVRVVGATQLNANISVGATAEIGMRTVVVTTGAESVSSANSFTVKAGATSGCVQPPSSLIGWWPLDETSGATARDLSGNNTGVHRNKPSFTVGKVAGGLQFDPMLDSSVEIANQPILNFGLQDFTIDVWVKLNGSGAGQQVILAKGNEGPNAPYYMLSLVNGAVHLDVWGGGYSSVTRITDNQWHFIAVTVDRDQANGVKFYIDGVQTYQHDARYFQQRNLTNSAPLVFGKSYHPNFPGALLGAMDEVELFTRTLTPTEILTLYNAGSHGKCKPATTIVDINASAANRIYLPLITR